MESWPLQSTGAAYGSTLKVGDQVIVSRDQRKVSRMVSRSMIAGLMSVGINIHNMEATAIPITRTMTPKIGVSGGIHVRVHPDKHDHILMSQYTHEIMSLVACLQALSAWLLCFKMNSTDVLSRCSPWDDKCPSAVLFIVTNWGSMEPVVAWPDDALKITLFSMMIIICASSSFWRRRLLKFVLNEVVLRRAACHKTLVLHSGLLRTRIHAPSTFSFYSELRSQPFVHLSLCQVSMTCRYPPWVSVSQITTKLTNAT